MAIETIFVVGVALFFGWLVWKLVSTQNLVCTLKDSVEKSMEAERLRQQREFKRVDPVSTYLSRLVTYLQRNPRDTIALAKIGDVYATGQYPYFHSNKDVAIACYRIVTECSKGTAIARLCERRIADVVTNPIPNEDDVGTNIPVGFAVVGCKLVMDAKHDEVVPLSYCQSERTNEQTFPRAFREDNAHVKPTRRPARTAMTGVHRRGHNTPPADENDGVRNPAVDYQNVHDSIVVSNTKREADKLKDESAAGDAKVDEFRDFVVRNDELSDADKSNALKVIDSLTDTAHSRFGMNENEALRKTLSKVEKAENTSNLKYTLAKNLASGVDGGVVVCSTGKIARILQVNQFFGERDDADVIMDEGSLKSMLNGAAASVRNRMLGAVPEERAVNYNVNGDEDMSLQMKTEFLKETEAFKAGHKDVGWKIDAIASEITEAF